MSTSGRPSPGRKLRRPRVAGLRRRESHDGRHARLPDENASESNGLADSIESESNSTAVTDERPSDTAPEHQDSVVVRKGVLDIEESAEESTADSAGEDVASVAESAADSAESDDTDSAAPQTPRDRRKMLVSALLAGTVLFAGLAAWFGSEVYALWFTGPATNQALVDTASTSAVTGQVTNAVQQVFSYDFADTAKTENAAKNVLVGQAVQQYNQLFGTVKQLAPQEKMVLTTTVTASGVMQLQGDRAQVLVFVNQNAVRTDTGQNNAGSGQITVDAVKQGNQWKIDQITER